MSHYFSALRSGNVHVQHKTSLMIFFYGSNDKKMRSMAILTDVVVGEMRMGTVGGFLQRTVGEIILGSLVF